MNTDIKYSTVGKGPKLVFIHGWSHSSDIWSNQIQELSKDYCCISLDLPGFGKSKPFGKNEPNIDNYANLIYDFIRKDLAYDNIHTIIADSLGAIIILKTLESYDLSVSKVICSGCPVNGLPYIIKFFAGLGLIRISLSAMKALPYSAARYFIKNSLFITARYPSKISNSVIQSIYEMDIYSASKLLDEMLLPFRFDYIKLNSLSCKYYILRGEFDKLISKDSSVSLAELLNGKYYEIANSGHTPMQENHETFLRIVMEILK